MPKWITTRRDRDSAKYKALHKELRRELKKKGDLLPEYMTALCQSFGRPKGCLDGKVCVCFPDKRTRKMQRSQDFRAGRT